MICLNVSKIVPKALLYVVAGMELALSLEKLVNEKLLNLHSVQNHLSYFIHPKSCLTECNIIL